MKNATQKFEIEIHGSKLNASVSFSDGLIFINSEFMGRKCGSVSTTIQEAISNTTIVPIKNYLRSLI